MFNSRPNGVGPEGWVFVGYLVRCIILEDVVQLDQTGQENGQAAVIIHRLHKVDQLGSEKKQEFVTSL